MSLEEKFETKEDLSKETLRILYLPKIKDKYMEKYDLTHQEYVDCVSIAKDWALEDNLSFTIDYFNNTLIKRKKMIGLFKLTGK